MLTKIKNFLTNKWVLLGSLITAVIFVAITIGLFIDLLKRIPAEQIPEVRALLAFAILSLLAIAFIVFLIYIISGKISGSAFITAAKSVTDPPPAK